MQVRSLASLSGLRIRRCRELGCRSQIQLGSYIAVAVVEAGGYSFDLTPSLGTAICCRCGPKKTRQKKKISPSFPDPHSLSPVPRASHLPPNIRPPKSRPLLG